MKNNEISCRDSEDECIFDSSEFLKLKAFLFYIDGPYLLKIKEDI